MASEKDSIQFYKDILGSKAEESSSGSSPYSVPSVKKSKTKWSRASKIMPVVVTAAVTFGVCAVALATQPKLQKWFRYCWDGDVEARKRRREIARANRLVKASLSKCSAKITALTAKLDKLETDLGRWQKNEKQQAKLRSVDPNHQKNSGYYHFASSGTKYVNKWDKFDADEELRKIDGQTAQDHDSTKSAAQKSLPTIDQLTKQARELTVAAKEILDKKLDVITHEMANSPHLFSDSRSLRKKRQRLCKVANENVIPRATDLVKAINKIRREREENSISPSDSERGDSNVPNFAQMSVRPICMENDGADNETADGRKSVAGSAWNKDNRQYEEKSVWDWSVTQLRDLLGEVDLDIGNGLIAHITNVTDAKGMATITATNRGPGCVFSFDSINCEWKSKPIDSEQDSSTAPKTVGTLTIRDVDVTDVSVSEIDEPLTIPVVTVTSGVADSSILRKDAATKLKVAFQNLLASMHAEFVR